MKNTESLRRLIVIRLFIPVFSVLATGCFANDNGRSDEITQRLLTEPVTGSYRWIMDTSGGIQIQLVQRIPDQTRSFYIARGFPRPAADRYAEACVFQTIFHNNSKDALVRIELSEWRVLADGGEKALRLEPAWQAEWKKMGVSQSARVAFKWSQFPSKQKHRPGDWFQGMIAAERPFGSELDLKVKWSENGVKHEAVIRDLKCAEDRTLTEDKE